MLPIHGVAPNLSHLHLLSSITINQKQTIKRSLIPICLSHWVPPQRTGAPAGSRWAVKGSYAVWLCVRWGRRLTGRVYLTICMRLFPPCEVMTRRSGLRLFTIWGLGGGGEDLAGTTFPRLLPLETVRSPGEALALLYPLAGWEREGFHHWLALVQEICKHLTKYSWTDMWTKGKCVKSF